MPWGMNSGIGCASAMGRGDSCAVPSEVASSPTGRLAELTLRTAEGCRIEAARRRRKSRWPRRGSNRCRGGLSSGIEWAIAMPSWNWSSLHSRWVRQWRLILAIADSPSGSNTGVVGMALDDATGAMPLKGSILAMSCSPRQCGSVVRGKSGIRDELDVSNFGRGAGGVDALTAAVPCDADRGERFNRRWRDETGSRPAAASGQRLSGTGQHRLGWGLAPCSLRSPKRNVAGKTDYNPAPSAESEKNRARSHQ